MRNQKKKEIRDELRNQRFGNSKTSDSLTTAKNDVFTFKMYANQLLSLDKMQVSVLNQWRAANTNRIISKSPRYPELVELRKHENTEKNKEEVAALVKELLGEQMNMPPDEAEKRITMLSELDYAEDYTAQGLELLETKLIKQVEDYMKENCPIYTNWMTKVRGLGAKTGAKLIAIIGDIRRFPTVSGLWHYFGVGNPEDSRMVAGKQLTYAPHAKSLVLGIIAPNFIKLNSQYRVFYDRRVTLTKQTKPEWHHLNPDGTKSTGRNMHPKHGMKDGQRVMMKRFLAELWDAWYRSIGMEPPTQPYVIEKLNHHRDEQLVPYEEKVA